MAKRYFLTLLLLIIGGLIWTMTHYEMDKLRTAVFVMAVSACAIINLIFFVPIKFPLRVLVAGITSSIIFFFIIQGSNVERTFFSSIGIINGVLCLFWLIVRWPKAHK